MASVQDIYELSPLQQGMLFHSLYAPDSGVYVEQRWCVIVGDLKVNAFQRAWDRVINRHDALRSELHWEETEKPVQVVYEEVKPQWLCEKPDDFEAFLESDRRRGFVLDEGPLVRFALFPLNDGRHQFVWTFHHALMDGWGNGVLIREALALYESEIHGGVTPALLPSMPHRSYIDWLQRRPVIEEEAYWKKALSGFDEPTQLFGGDRVDVDGSDYCVHSHSLSAASTIALREFAQTNRLTVNTLVQGAWALLLERYTGQEDVLFGATVSGRPPTLDGVETAIGLFINTVPVRVDVNSSQPLVQWLEAIQSDQRQRESYGYQRLLDLQAFTEVPSGTPLFESLIVFENYPVSIDSVLANQSSGLQLVERDGYERTNYPLTLVALPGDELVFSFRYESQHFDRKSIERIAEQLEHVLSGFARGVDQVVGDVDSLPERDQVMLGEWGQGPTAAVDAIPVHERMAQQAVSLPGKVAVVFGQESLDYQSLERQSSRLAEWLREHHNIGRGDRVGVFLERTPKLVIGLLGVLKSGAAYVPLDRNFPAERLRAMAEDAELSLLLHDGESLSVDAAFGNLCEGIRLDELSLEDQPEAAGRVVVSDDDPAYIIYTSGSTGKPKGVAITHGNLNNFLEAMQREPGIGIDDVLLAVTTVSFDIAVLELFLPLVAGAKVVLGSAQQARDGAALRRLINEHSVNVVQATPATWRLVVESAGNSAKPSLRILCGGEALDVALAQRLLEYGKEVWNLYGPTETTIWSSALRVTSELLESGLVPIGGPILNTRFEIRDARGRQVPPGTVGELHIGGLGVSPGYWKQSALTKVHFQEGVYATGDSVRLREDGCMVFLGRLDGQIKLRGFRIELGEIEATLNQHPEVLQAIAVLQSVGGAEKRIAAFIRAEQGLSPEVLRDFLECRFPAYMVPSCFELVEEFPMTLNRKIDRRTLETVAVSSSKGQNATVGFRSPREELVAGVWGEVLGFAIVSPSAHFFQIGGHSLAATRVLGRLRDALGVDASLRLLFENPILSDFVSAIDREKEATRDTIPMIEVDPNQLPVSAAQRRQWLMAKLLPEASIYAIPTAVRVTGKLSLARLQEGLQRVVDKHEGLRLAFRDEMGSPVGYLVEDLQVTIEEVDLTGVGADRVDSALNQAMRKSAQVSFDLAEAPLWRAVLFRLAEEQQVFCLTLHHILADGWSLGILVREVVTAYGGDGFVDEAEWRYTDYTAWQEGEDHARDLAYWKKALEGTPPLLELPTDFPRPAEGSYQGGIVEFELSKDEQLALIELGQREGTTLFMTLLTAFNVLLYRYTGSRDLPIGTPVANRARPEFETIFGLFVNTLVVRTRLQGNPKLAELLANTRQQTLAAYEHQEAPFEEVIEALGVPRSRASTPLFQVLFTLQNAPLEQVSMQGLEWSPLSVDTGTSKFDLSLAMRETPSGLVARFEYSIDLFRPESMERMACAFKTLLKLFPERTESPLSSLTVLDRKAQENLARLGMGKVPERNEFEETIHAQFDKQAESTPEAVALEQGNETFSYRVVAERADAIAEQLKALGVVAETPVGIPADRSPMSIHLILGILKAGGVYVPLERTLPTSRLQWMIADTGIQLAVADDRAWLESLFPHAEHQQFSGLGGVYSAVIGDLKPLTKATAGEASLAYILYTSGSTGHPKGVCTPHRAVVRLVRATNYMRFGPGEVSLQAAPLGFDASTLEVWGPLLNGGKLVLPTSATLSLEEIAALVEDHQVTMLWLTAGLFHAMVDECYERLKPVRQLLSGGDVLSMPHLRKAQAVNPETQLINGYGPTEGTTFTCCHTFLEMDWASAPIGKPISNTTIYVLDEDLQQVPEGAVGELYIGGRGLARGYLNQPSLTAASFIPNPFFDVQRDALVDENMTLYRSGDQVRFRQGGVLEFLGRLDNQVKLRGFRIEPGEIESLLKERCDVRDSVVVALSDATHRKRLVAYVISDVPDLDGAELNKYLSEQLPPQMLPSHYEMVESFPLNTNGKLDHQSLPVPKWPSGEGTVAREASTRERTVQVVWESLLPCESVGLYDNFFELGGDSILALQIVSRLRRVGLEATPAQLFLHQTVAELAAVVSEHPDVVPAEFAETSPNSFSPIPVQLWFLESNLAKAHHFNQACCVSGADDVNAACFAAALAAVFTHHDALRLRASNGKLRYVNAEAPAVVWHDISKMDEVAQQMHRSFHLVDGPLFQVAGFRDVSEGDLTLFFVAHHFVVDTVSWRIFLEDLHDAYIQALASKPILLPSKTASFESWAQALQASVPEARKDRAYWEQVVNDAQTLSTLQELDAAATPDMQRIESVLSKVVSDSVIQATSTQSILLAALAEALQKWSGDESVVIDLESHGRDAESLGVELDVTRTVGWFTTIYPINLRVLTNGSDLEVLQKVRDQLDAVPAKGLSYGMLRYLDNDRDLAVDSAVSFNYLGQLDANAGMLGSFRRMEAPGDPIAPENRLAHALTVNCWVENRTLVAAWSYDTSRVSKAVIEELASHYVSVIERLAMTDSGEVQPDADLSGLSMDQLSAVAAQVRFDGVDS